MKKEKNFVPRILVTVALVFSLYTMAVPWVRIHPVLSELMSLAESTNNAAVDGISAIVGTVTSLFDSDDAAEGKGTDAGNAIIRALSDEKEVVEIISRGECTPYDCSKIFQIVGTYVDDESAKTGYLAAGWLFYAVCALGVVAVAAAVSGRYACALLYAVGAGVEMLLVSSSVTWVNDSLNAAALSLMDSMKMAGAGAAAAGLLAFIGIVSAGSAGGTGEEGAERKMPLGDASPSGNSDRMSRGPEAGGSYDDDRIKGGESRAREGTSGKEPEHRRMEDPQARETRIRRQRVIWGVLLSALLLFLVAGGIYTLIKNMSPVTIDLSTYAGLRIEGYNGYGRASCDFSEDAFVQDLERLVLDRNGGGGKNALSEEDAEEIAWSVYESMQVAISEESGLSNGDEVSLDVTADPEAVEILGQHHVKARFADAHIAEEVKGLSEVRDYDPFEDVSIEFQGAEPYGEAIVTYAGDYGDLIRIEAEPREGLRNGDEVEISILSEYEEDALIEEYGIRLMRDRKTVEASGLLYYPERIEELEEGELSRIRETAQRIARDHIEDEYESDEQLTGLVSCGQYFAAAAAEGSDFHNQMYCLYEVHYANNSGGSEKYYYYVRLENIMVDPKTDGVVADYDYVSVPQKPSLSADTLNLSEFVVVRLLPPRILSGFTSEQSFYSNCILPLEEACIVSST